jgi:putative ABC transport system ATP-binding protein
MPLVRLENLEKSIANPAGRIWLLRRIGFAIEPGEFVTIMGPSGAGKSTLLHILGMLDGEWQGEYWFDDQPVHELALKKRNELHKANIGFVFQQYHLLDDLTVAENLDVPLSYRDLKKPRTGSRWSPTPSTASASSARRTSSPASSPAVSSSWSASRAR